MSIAISKEKVQAQNGLMMIYSFITLLLTNAIVLMLANLLAPAHVVLGTFSISAPWAVFHSMLILTVIVTFTMPLVTYYEWKNKLAFTPKQWILTYFVVNLFALWFITRFAQNLGLGVSSWLVLVVLVAVFNWLQGLAMMTLGKLVK